MTHFAPRPVPKGLRLPRLRKRLAPPKRAVRTLVVTLLRVATTTITVAFFNPISKERGGAALLLIFRPLATRCNYITSALCTNGLTRGPHKTAFLRALYRLFSTFKEALSRDFYGDATFSHLLTLKHCTVLPAALTTCLSSLHLPRAAWTVFFMAIILTGVDVVSNTAVVVLAVF